MISYFIYRPTFHIFLLCTYLRSGNFVNRRICYAKFLCWNTRLNTMTPEQTRETLGPYLACLTLRRTEWRPYTRPVAQPGHTGQSIRSCVWSLDSGIKIKSKITRGSKYVKCSRNLFVSMACYRLFTIISMYNTVSYGRTSGRHEACMHVMHCSCLFSPVRTAKLRKIRHRYSVQWTYNTDVPSCFSRWF